MEQITSRANPLMTFTRKLRDSRSFRREQGLYLCDGVKVLRDAVAAGAAIEVFLCTAEHRALAPAGARCVEVPPDVMKSLSPMQAPQGVLFLVRAPELTPPELLPPGRYLVLDGVQDPGNVGTIFRTADAFGASGVLLTNHCADPWNPKTARASMGASFRLPVYEAAPETLAPLAARSGLKLCATALREDTVSLPEAHLKDCVVLIGSEGRGVSPGLLAQCAETIRIPMQPQCESLNAAVAASIVLWEMYRA